MNADFRTRIWLVFTKRVQRATARVARYAESR